MDGAMSVRIFKVHPFLPKPSDFDIYAENHYKLFSSSKDLKIIFRVQQHGCTKF